MAEELRVSYSAGMKVNIGNYQSVDVHFSESRSIETGAGASQTEIDAASDVLKANIKERVDSDLVDAVGEIKETFGA